MPIINIEGNTIEDHWQIYEDAEDVPSDGDVILPLAVMSALGPRLSNHNGRLGLFIENDADVEAHKDEIAKAELIVLSLPAFTDGRAYSQARLLREVLNYDKELRVKGDVLVDQAAYLVRCGFDSFEFDGEIDHNSWRQAVSFMSASYQRNYRGGLANRST